MSTDLQEQWDALNEYHSFTTASPASREQRLRRMRTLIRLRDVDKRDFARANPAFKVDNPNFHPGCYGCSGAKDHGVGYCLGCKYCQNFDSNPTKHTLELMFEARRNNP